MTKTELKQYIEWLIDIGACQICGATDLDIPHHVLRGAYKDDYMQILLCTGCHRKIHNVTFEWHTEPDFEEMKLIAIENWSDYDSTRN